MINLNDIMETITMIQEDNLDNTTITREFHCSTVRIRTLTAHAPKSTTKIMRLCGRLVPVGEEIEKTYGIPIINKRISVTPIAMLAASANGDPVMFAKTLEKAARETGVNFIGGFSALVQKGFSAGDRELIGAIPQALAETDHVCSSINIGSTKAGINMDAVRLMGQTIVKSAELTKGP